MLIYLVKNKINNKCYIGKTTKTMSERISGHYKTSKLGSETNFHRALRKYDKDNFEWKMLVECKTEDELNKKEMYFIKKYNTYTKGYNMTIGGDGGSTYNKNIDNYHRIKHKLGKWKNGNPGSTSEAIDKRRKTFQKMYDTGKIDSSLETNKNVIAQPNRQRIRVYGVEFDSYTEASKVYGVTIRTVSNRCKNKYFKEWQIIKI